MMASFAFDSISTGQRVPGSQVEIVLDQPL